MTYLTFGNTAGLSLNQLQRQGPRIDPCHAPVNLCVMAAKSLGPFAACANGFCVTDIMGPGTKCLADVDEPLV